MFKKQQVQSLKSTQFHNKLSVNHNSQGIHSGNFGAGQ